MSRDVYRLIKSIAKTGEAISHLSKDLANLSIKEIEEREVTSNFVAQKTKPQNKNPFDPVYFSWVVIVSLIFNIAALGEKSPDPVEVFFGSLVILSVFHILVICPLIFLANKMNDIDTPEERTKTPQKEMPKTIYKKKENGAGCGCLVLFSVVITFLTGINAPPFVIFLTFAIGLIMWLVSFIPSDDTKVETKLQDTTKSKYERKIYYDCHFKGTRKTQAKERGYIFEKGETEKNKLRAEAKLRDTAFWAYFAIWVDLNNIEKEEQEKLEDYKGDYWKAEWRAE